MRAFAFVAQQQQKIEKTVAERLPAQRRHAVPAIDRNELGSRVQAIEIFADDGGIVEHRAVIEYQRRDLESGLSSISATCGLVVAATVRTHSIRPPKPSSCTTIITLRTKGDAGTNAASSEVLWQEPADGARAGFGLPFRPALSSATAEKEDTLP